MITFIALHNETFYLKLINNKKITNNINNNNNNNNNTNSEKW